MNKEQVLLLKKQLVEQLDLFNAINANKKERKKWQDVYGDFLGVQIELAETHVRMIEGMLKSDIQNDPKIESLRKNIISNAKGILRNMKSQIKYYKSKK